MDRVAHNPAILSSADGSFACATPDHTLGLVIREPAPPALAVFALSQLHASLATSHGDDSHAWVAALREAVLLTAHTLDLHGGRALAPGSVAFTALWRRGDRLLIAQCGRIPVHRHTATGWQSVTVHPNPATPSPAWLSAQDLAELNLASLSENGDSCVPDASQPAITVLTPRAGELFVCGACSAESLRAISNATFHTALPPLSHDAFVLVRATEPLPMVPYESAQTPYAVRERRFTPCTPLQLERIRTCVWASNSPESAWESLAAQGEIPMEWVDAPLRRFGDGQSEIAHTAPTSLDDCVWLAAHGQSVLTAEALVHETRALRHAMGMDGHSLFHWRVARTPEERQHAARLGSEQLHRVSRAWRRLADARGPGIAGLDAGVHALLELTAPSGDALPRAQWAAWGARGFEMILHVDAALYPRARAL